MQTNTQKRALITPGAILLSLLPGIIGGFFTMEGVREWYPTLVKPIFTPPNWVFGPVWTTLYIMMGYSFARILLQEKHTQLVKWSVGVFVIQLVLNGLWSFLFFGLQDLVLAYVEIILLWGSIVLTMALFAKQDKLSGWLLVPYFCWVSFASCLNLALIVLNT